MICPTELDLSDKNDNKTQDMSDRLMPMYAYLLLTSLNVCLSHVRMYAYLMSDKKCNKMQDMSDRARCVRQKLQKNARYVRQS